MGSKEKNEENIDNQRIEGWKKWFGRATEWKSFTEMKEIFSPEMAKYLYEGGEEVFMLFPDGSQAEVEKLEQINAHQGIFGYEVTHAIN